jgi:hypothetical protein
MRIEYGEGGGLALQRSQQRQQQAVLEAIRVIAGVKGVAIIHGKRLMGQGAAGRNGAASGLASLTDIFALAGGALFSGARRSRSDGII